VSHTHATPTQRATLWICSIRGSTRRLRGVAVAAPLVHVLWRLQPRRRPFFHRTNGCGAWHAIGIVSFSRIRRAAGHGARLPSPPSSRRPPPECAQSDNQPLDKAPALGVASSARGSVKSAAAAHLCWRRLPGRERGRGPYLAQHAFAVSSSVSYPLRPRALPAGRQVPTAVRPRGFNLRVNPSLRYHGIAVV
jgi:hypothetical protein